MIYKVKMTEQAGNDMRNIYEYIAIELQSPDIASSLFKRIEKCILSLEHMPERYRVYDKKMFHDNVFRVVSVGNYCVFYNVDNINLTVNIIRVMYGGRDIDSRLAEK